MSFLRHREIYRSDGLIPACSPGRTDCGQPRPHRLDEFPAGYSSAGCSPAEPASASPAAGDCTLHFHYRSRIFHRTANSVLTGCLSLGAHPKVSLRTFGDALHRRIDPAASNLKQASLTSLQTLSVSLNYVVASHRDGAAI